MTPAVEFKKVTKRFPGAAAPALDRVSLAIAPGFCQGSARLYFAKPNTSTKNLIQHQLPT